MAQLAPTRAYSHFATPAADLGTVLRPIKARLHARFPAVKSSHLTEALAAALDFKSNAALRASSTPMYDLLALKSFEPERLHQRLVDFGYELQPDFQFGPSPQSHQPPAHYLEWLSELHELEKAPDRRWPRIEALRDACAREFAETFGLGHRENRDDISVVRRWSAGVDHGACLPNWGAELNSSRGGLVSFPGTDHRYRFCQALPLANGKTVEYESAMVSMPYAKKDQMPSDHEAASRLAGRIGWTCSIHNEWSWYGVGKTALVLFKRSTPHAQMLRAWEHSFQRWMVENRARIAKSASATRRMVIEDILYCQHLPLDLADFEDCRERYLKEFALHMYDMNGRGMALVFKRLMETWARERGTYL